MFRHLLLAALCTIAAATVAAAPVDGFAEQMGALLGRSGSPLRLKGDDVAVTKASFRPPVEILIEAKTDSKNLRLSYAAKQIIFMWEGRPAELRVDGGPASGQHKLGAGLIRPHKYVTIRWLVTPGKQMIYVDGELRFEHQGDYSKINDPIGVFPAGGSEVTVKSIRVKQLPPGTE